MLISLGALIQTTNGIKMTETAFLFLFMSHNLEQSWAITQHKGSLHNEMLIYPEVCFHSTWELTKFLEAPMAVVTVWLWRRASAKKQ